MSHPLTSPPIQKELNHLLGEREESQQWQSYIVDNGPIPSTEVFQSQTPPATSKFKATTIAPSPPPHLSTPTPKGSSHTLSALDTSSPHLQPSPETPSGRSPLSAGLRITTDIIPGYMVTAASANTGRVSGEFARPQPLPVKPAPIARTPSIKNVLASSLGSNHHLGSAPSSALSSPMLNAMHMSDVTPLPSPLMTGDSPGPWMKLVQRPNSRDLMVPHSADSALVTANGESISAAIANQSKRRAYHTLLATANEAALANPLVNREKGLHSRERSISEYIPDAIPVPQARHITVSGNHDTGTPDSATFVEGHLRREPHLAAQRLAIPGYVDPLFSWFHCRG